MSGLTALQIKNAPSGRHADGRGLYLLVKPSGARSWILRVQVIGRRRDFGLGSYPMIGLAEAREKAAAGLKIAKAGLDPSREWKKSTAGIPTFEGAAKLYHGSIKLGWKNPKHSAQWLATLNTYAFPTIGSLQVEQIQASDIARVLEPIWLKIPETARRIRQRIAAVLDFAHGQGWRANEAPIRAVSKLLKGIRQPKPGNFAAMPYPDLPAFVRQLSTRQQSTGRRALLFLILTAARSGELRGATWGEIDLAAKLWSIPGSRMKASESHCVPLSSQALDILAALPGDRGPDILLFPGLPRNGRARQMSDMTLAKAFKSAGGSGFTVHGLRSSFRDWAAEKSGMPGEWAEAALAHRVPNKTEAAYRRTRFLEQRIRLMSDWALFCTCPASSGAH